MDPEMTSEDGPMGVYRLEIHHCTGLQSHEIRVPSIRDLATNNLVFTTGAFWDVTSHKWGKDGRSIVLHLRFYDPGNTNYFVASLDFRLKTGVLTDGNRTIWRGSLSELSKKFSTNEAPGGCLSLLVTGIFGWMFGKS